jgi:acyl dehydratase
LGTASTKVEMPKAVITQDMIDEMNSKVGTKLRLEHSINNEEATRFAIRKFADGIGDSNPLWSDIEYARKTKYGTIAAPPSWIFSVLGGIQFGWRGLGGFHSSSEVEFYKPVLLNDKIIPECYFLGFDGPKPSSFAEKVVINKKEARYMNQRNELVASNKWFVTRIERGKAKGKSIFSDIELPHPWTQKQLDEIEKQVLNEEIRASKTRYWEDVEIGQELGPIVKGPIGVTDEIAFLIGGGAPIPRLAANGVRLRQFQTHPAWSFRDPSTYALEPIYSVHYNKEAAFAQGGLPMPYDVGVQRFCWQIQLLTNWMGDAGWLKKSSAQYRKFVFFSDVVWLTGKVTKRYIDSDGEFCVDVETSAINQRGDVVMSGRATIALPSKTSELFPLSRRLSATSEGGKTSNQKIQYNNAPH